MRDDVTEWLVVNVASGVDGSESKGLFHLEVCEMTVCLVRIIKGGLYKLVAENKKNEPPLVWIYQPGSSVIV